MNIVSYFERGRSTIDSKWGEGRGAENTFFSVTLYNSQKRGGRGEGLKRLPSPLPSAGLGTRCKSISVCNVYAV